LAVGVVAEIKGRLPVADVVGETVQLKKAGTTLKGLCPFHGEKTPSFVVTPARDTWHCFGCGKHGDIFTFVMERDGLAFPEALRTLAARAGVEIDERTKREDAHNARLREVMDGDRARGFDRLRKEYPHRREFGRWCIQLEGSAVGVSERLSSLGFRVESRGVAAVPEAG